MGGASGCGSTTSERTVNCPSCGVANTVASHGRPLGGGPPRQCRGRATRGGVLRTREILRTRGNIYAISNASIMRPTHTGLCAGPGGTLSRASHVGFAARPASGARGAR